MDTPPKLSGFSQIRLIVRWMIWGLLWSGGTVITSVSLSHLLADRHTWDARVSLPVRATGEPHSATFRTFSGGAVALFATSLAHGHSGRTPFRGTVVVNVVDHHGNSVRNIVLAPSGVRHEQSTDSSWTTLGTLTAPRLWLKPWRLLAHVAVADPAFPAERLEVMIRKVRPELGMGGMVFYITIFIGFGLLGGATLVAAASTSLFGKIPLFISAASVIGCGLLLF